MTQIHKKYSKQELQNMSINSLRRIKDDLSSKEVFIDNPTDVIDSSFLSKNINKTQKENLNETVKSKPSNPNTCGDDGRSACGCEVQHEWGLCATTDGPDYCCDYPGIFTGQGSSTDPCGIEGNSDPCYCIIGTSEEYTGFCLDTKQKRRRLTPEFSNIERREGGIAGKTRINNRVKRKKI